MRLAQPISELRKKLREQSIQDLAGALLECKELLPEGSEKYDLVMKMRASLQQLAKDKARGVITQDENSIRIARIQDAFLDFVSSLEEADFESPAAKADPSKPQAQHGSVLYHIPHSMPLNKASYCKVRVAIEEDAIFEDIIMDDDVRIRERVEVSERMSAELVDTAGRVFDILPLNSKDQAIRPTGYTQWLFRVTPLVEGEHQLMVKVSLLAFDPNTKEYVPRDVSVLETVTVVTASQQSDEEETAFKPTGHSFALGPSTGEVTQPEDTNKGGNVSTFPFSIRTMSFFLTFLVFAYSVGYSIARPLDAKLIVASIQGKEALTQFIAENKDEAPGGLKNPVIETAYFRIAKKSGELADLREYQELYTEKGKFGKDVLQKIATLEWKAVESIQQKPSLLSIQKYLHDFPDATRLPQVFDAAQAISATEQDEVLPKIEQAYVKSMELQPTARKIEQYSQDFPELGKLNTLAEIAAKNDDVLPQAQPVLERVVLQKVKTAENAQQVRALLPSLKIAAQGRPEAEVFQKVEKAATQNDLALSRALQADLRALQAENAATARLEEEKRLAAEKAREDSTRLAEQKVAEAKRQKGAEQAKKDQEAKEADTKAEKDRKDKEAADKAEKERLEKEVTAKAEQERKDKEAAQAAEKASSTPDNSIPRPTMVSVKGGTFEMGDVMGDKEYDEEEVHTVTVSDFMISKTEVTFEEYDRFCAATKTDKPDDEKWGRAKYPVINVSWEDAIAYCNWLSEKHGLQPVYSGQGSSTTANWSANGYRLPTEAEWEYAARGGGKKIRFGNGKDVADPKEINFDASADYKKPYSTVGTYRRQTVPVGSLNSPNALGLHDMSGNVREWCWDWYDANYYNNSPTKDPKGPTSGDFRVVRGGSWYLSPNGSRVAYRYWLNPDYRGDITGFRVLRH